MVYGSYNELVTGANLNQLITGGPHIVYIYIYFTRIYGSLSWGFIIKLSWGLQFSHISLDLYGFIVKYLYSL